jgi:hypothetical protein
MKRIGETLEGSSKSFKNLEFNQLEKQIYYWVTRGITELGEEQL